VSVKLETSYSLIRSSRVVDSAISTRFGGAPRVISVPLPHGSTASFSVCAQRNTVHRVGVHTGYVRQDAVGFDNGLE
jgi:hypothetical protein